jgi:hypothetical protein
VLVGDHAEGLIGPFRDSVYQDDAGAFAGEKDSRGAAVANPRSTRTGAGHDGDFVLESASHAWNQDLLLLNEKEHSVREPKIVILV